MSSVTSTSAGHPTRERQRIRNNRGSVGGKSKGCLCVCEGDEGERGCLNRVTCLPFYLTATPLGYSLFTLSVNSLCSVCCLGKDDGGSRGRVEMNTVERVL